MMKVRHKMDTDEVVDAAGGCVGCLALLACGIAGFMWAVVLPAIGLLYVFGFLT